MRTPLRPCSPGASTGDTACSSRSSKSTARASSRCAGCGSPSIRICGIGVELRAIDAPVAEDLRVMISSCSSLRYSPPPSHQDTPFRATPASRLRSYLIDSAACSGFAPSMRARAVLFVGARGELEGCLIVRQAGERPSPMPFSIDQVYQARDAEERGSFRYREPGRSGRRRGDAERVAPRRAVGAASREGRARADGTKPGAAGS